MYYTLENRTDKEVGSVFPQASCLSQMDAHRLSNDEFPAFTPTLNFELVKKAKLTDVLSQAAISAQGLLINEQFKKLLEEFNLMQHKFYAATVKTKKGDTQYYWMHLSDRDLINCIDYKASKFFRTEYGYREENIELTSFDDYKSKKAKFGKMGTIQSDFIKLNDKFPKNLDCFILPLFDAHLYLSESLTTAVRGENITGIEIKEATTIDYKPL
jgi:hypothetical protein